MTHLIENAPIDNFSVDPSEWNTLTAVIAMFKFCLDIFLLRKSARTSRCGFHYFSVRGLEDIVIVTDSENDLDHNFSTVPKFVPVLRR